MTNVFPGDYFEQQWGPEDRALTSANPKHYRHWIRIHQGPTPAPRPPATLEALARTVRSSYGEGADSGVPVPVAPEPF